MLFKNLVDYSDPNSFANRVRRKRSTLIKQLVEDAFHRFGHCRIIDLGGTYVYWSIFSADWLSANNVKITLLNLEPVSIPQGTERQFDSVAGDARNLSRYQDKEFDFVHSNSVIEHVGSWADMCEMATEVERVGKSYYCQTPYYWFPIEPHFVTPFIHWLPMSIRTKIAMRVALGNWPKAVTMSEAIRAQSSAVLLDKEMMTALFIGASIEFERFLGFPKSLLAYKRLTYA